MNYFDFYQLADLVSDQCCSFSNLIDKALKHFDVLPSRDQFMEIVDFAFQIVRDDLIHRFDFIFAEENL